MKRKVSIIIPFYNASKCIKTCVDSLKKQTLADFEAIFVDDGSSDNSVEQLLNHWDERFVLLQQENKGVSAARNLGLRCATGDYIAFMDVDDSLSENYLMLLFEAAQQYNTPVVLCDYLEVRGENRYLEVKLPWENQLIYYETIVEELIPNMVAGDGIRGLVWRTFIKKSFWDELQLYFDERVHIAEDLLFLIRLYHRANSIYIVSKSLYQYRINVNSTLNRYHPDSVRRRIEFYDILRTVLEDEGLFEENKNAYYLNRLHMYTWEISNLVRAQDWQNRKKEMLQLREALKCEQTEWREYPLSKGRRLSLWMLEHEFDSLLLTIYKIKEWLRLKELIKS